MSEEQFAEIMARFDSVEGKLDQQDRRITQLDRRVEAFSDEFRDRIRVMEASFLNEVRSLGLRLRQIEDAA